MAKRKNTKRRRRGKGPQSKKRNRTKEERALARKAQAGVAERMAAGMTEDEAIEDLLRNDDSMTREAATLSGALEAGDQLESKLRATIRKWIIERRPIEEIRDMAAEIALKKGGPRQPRHARQMVIEKVERLITQEMANLEDPEPWVLDAKRVALLKGASAEEAEAEADKLRQQVETIKQTQREQDEVDANLRKMLAELKPGELQATLNEVGETHGGESRDMLAGLVIEMLAERREQLGDLLEKAHTSFAFTFPDPKGRPRKDPQHRTLASSDPLVQEAFEKALDRLDQVEKAIFVDTLLGQLKQAKDEGREMGPIDLDLEIDIILSRRGPGRSWFITNSTEVYSPHQQPKPQEATVEAYMETTAHAFHLTRGIKEPKQRQDAIYLWQCLREARVFHFEPEVYAGLHMEIDRYTTEDLAGLEYKTVEGGGLPAKRSPPEETDHLRKVVLREGKRAPYPDKFPFPSCFIGYGNGVDMPLWAIQLKAPFELRDKLQQGGIMGHLITDDGYVVAVIKALAQDDDGMPMSVVWFNHLRDQHGGWALSEFNLEPWILPGLIKIINDHRTFILETPLTSGMRQHYKHNRKKLGGKSGQRGYTPPPYYTLRLKSKLIRDKVRRGLPKPATPRSYRTDVRGHERCRVMRGPMPLDPELGAKLRKREYKIFTTNDLDADTLRRLHERGLPYKKADEWLAIRTSWIGEHFNSNDESLPYVPACRVPGEVRVKPKQPSRSWVDDPASTGANP